MPTPLYNPNPATPQHPGGGTYFGNQANFWTSNPYIYPGVQTGYQPGDPNQFAPPIAVRNLATSGTLQELGLNPADWSFGPQQPLYNPPGTSSLMQTMQALQAMQGGASPTRFGETPRERNIGAQNIAQQGTAAQRGLVTAEPQRIASLLQMLMSLYQMGPQMFQQQQTEQAALMNQYTQEKQGIASQYGQIPIVGPLIAGIAGL